MTTKSRGKSPKASAKKPTKNTPVAAKKKSQASDEVFRERVTTAAVMLLRSYIERGKVGKRGAIQSEAWRRLRETIDLPADKKDEARRAKLRAERAKARRKEHPYASSLIMQWFKEGFRRGTGLDD